MLFQTLLLEQLSAINTILDVLLPLACPGFPDLTALFPATLLWKQASQCGKQKANLVSCGYEWDKVKEV